MCNTLRERVRRETLSEHKKKHVESSVAWKVYF